MRKLMRTRRLPQIALMLAMLFYILQPKVGMGEEERQPNTDATLSEETAIKPTYDTAAAQTAAERIRSEMRRIAQRSYVSDLGMQSEQAPAEELEFDSESPLVGALDEQERTDEHLSEGKASPSADDSAAARTAAERIRSEMRRIAQKNSEPDLTPAQKSSDAPEEVKEELGMDDAFDSTSYLDGALDQMPETEAALAGDAVFRSVDRSVAQSAAERIRREMRRIAQENAKPKPRMAMQEKKKETPAAPKYNQSIYSALSQQKLTPHHLDVWRARHPLSTLNHLEKMSPAQQRSVANTATFIRKVNGKIPHETAWREACALVFYSAKYNIPANLAIGVANAESHFNPNAASKAGALGVMQVMWKVHNGMLRARGIAPTRDHLFDPERGIEAGVLLLSRYLSAYGTVQKALNKYYGGISARYVRKINNNMARLERHSRSTGY